LGNIFCHRSLPLKKASVIYAINRTVYVSSKRVMQRSLMAEFKVFLFFIQRQTESKKMRFIKRVLFLGLCVGLLYSATACVVVHKRDNGRHYGWYKRDHKPSNAHRLPGQPKKHHKQNKPPKQKSR